jgi:hypothetical protein
MARLTDFHRQQKSLNVKSYFFLKKRSSRAKKTLVEEFLRREPVGLLSANNSSPRVFFALNEEYLHREFFWLATKNIFTESFCLRRELFLLSAKNSSPGAQGKALA